MPVRAFPADTSPRRRRPPTVTSTEASRCFPGHVAAPRRRTSTCSSTFLAARKSGETQGAWRENNSSSPNPRPRTPDVAATVPRHGSVAFLSSSSSPPAIPPLCSDSAGEAETMGGEDDDAAAVRAEESVSGGVDVWSDAVSSHDPDHLLVMVHGILGSTADWQYGAKEFVKQLPDDVIVHCSEKNSSMLTLDGVDVMGERLADEVLDVVSRRPELTKISFLAHSVGGLAARYAIAKLYRPPDGVSDGNTKGTICGLEAINFITVATPHLGSRGNKQVPLLFGSLAMEKVACRIVHWIFRRTGKHLFLTDGDEGQPPLLQRMVEDHGDLYFISALRAFKRRVVYANADCDHIVGWRTSSIRRNTELPELAVSSSEKYPHIVHEEYSEEIDDEKCQDSMTDCNLDILEEKMVTGLRRVSWEKVDVSFQSSMTSFAAHSIIQVKYEFMNDGADVIQHIIDHFQL